MRIHKSIIGLFLCIVGLGLRFTLDETDISFLRIGSYIVGGLCFITGFLLAFDRGNIFEKADQNKTVIVPKKLAAFCLLFFGVFLRYIFMESAFSILRISSRVLGTVILIIGFMGLWNKSKESKYTGDGLSEPK